VPIRYSLTRPLLLRAMMRKPSCLISCSHWLPDGSFEVFVGRHGAMNPAGKVRCNMCPQLKTIAAHLNHFLLRDSGDE